MKTNLLLITAMLVQWLSSGAGLVRQNSAISVQNDQATITFPERITFSASLQSGADIQDVTLEYGVDELTCGTLVSKAFPDFKAGRTVDVSWSWEMKQTEALPTGANIWWRWKASDGAGNNLVTEKQTITWIDQVHPWKEVSAPNLDLHWYQGDNSFGGDLLKTAENSLTQLGQQIGLKADGTINLYIFANSADLNSTVYYQPEWTGGLAFPEYNIVLIGISADQIVWGRHAETHELTHVLVGHLTFSCLGGLPTWLNEGLAKYSEGQWDTSAQAMLKAAIADDSIFSVRSLSSSFPADTNRALLAYSQSQSLVTFMIAQYGRDKLLSLLKSERDGTTIDAALQQVYGFNQDGLEDAWRASVGARPRAAAPETGSATPTPTAVPTIVPISAAPLSLTPPPGSGNGSPQQPALPPASDNPGLPPANLALAGLLCAGLVCLGLALAIAAIAIVIVQKNRKKA